MRACFISLLYTLMTSANTSLEKKIFLRVENVIKELVLGYASSNSYASFVLSKLPACFISRWTHVDIWTNCELVKFYAASSMLESSRIVDSLDGLSPWSKKHLKSAREIKYRFVKTLWVEDTFDIGNFHLFI